MPKSSTPSANGAQKPGRSTESKILYYNWVGGSQHAPATSVSVNLSQVQPRGVVPSAHSLAELAVTNSTGTERVEVGWTDDPALNGTERPALFVNATIDGQSVYSEEAGSGFVQTSKNMHPGDAVKLGAIGNYAINYVHKDGGRWDVLYDGRQLGYYPESLWRGDFTHADLTSAFGETESPRKHAGISMGNGQRGTSHKSARISEFQLFRGGSSLTARLVPYADSEGISAILDFDPGNAVPITGPNPPYDYGYVTHNGLNFGGPGN
jgi:hypothetical protein